MERITGLVFSGFMCRLYGVAMAAWIGYEAAVFISGAFGSVAAAWPL